VIVFLLRYWKWIAGGIGALLVLSFIGYQINAYGDRRYEAGKAKVQAAWDKDAHDRQEAYMALQADYRAREQQFTGTVAKIEQEKTNANARTADLQRRLADSLRRRPERPVGLPDAGAVGPDGKDPPKCTGAQLYRDDLQFLQREAEAADGLRHALRACYDQYDAALGATNH